MTAIRDKGSEIFRQCNRVLLHPAGPLGELQGEKALQLRDGIRVQDVVLPRLHLVGRVPLVVRAVPGEAVGHRLPRRRVHGPHLHGDAVVREVAGEERDAKVATIDEDGRRVGQGLRQAHNPDGCHLAVVHYEPGRDDTDRERVLRHARNDVHLRGDAVLRGGGETAHVQRGLQGEFRGVLPLDLIMAHVHRHRLPQGDVLRHGVVPVLVEFRGHVGRLESLEVVQYLGMVHGPCHRRRIHQMRPEGHLLPGRDVRLLVAGHRAQEGQDWKNPSHLCVKIYYKIRIFREKCKEKGRLFATLLRDRKSVSYG